MRDKDELDLVIDAALLSYGDPSVHDQLEDRILRGVRQQVARERTPQRRWLPWAAALAAALLLALFFVAHSKLKPRPENNAQQAQPHAPVSEIAKSAVPAPQVRDHSAPVQPPVLAADFQPKHKPVHEPGPVNNLPKQDDFPAYPPPSEDDTALSFFIQRAPPREVQELLTAQVRTDAPVTIDELEIPPIAPLNDGGK